MKYLKFTIENFKGIQKLEFDLDGKSPISKISTLVGLNESGKTTILEALSFFYDNIKEEKELTITKAIVDDVHELIPKSKKGLFNDSITISAFVLIEDSDKEQIKKYCEEQKLDYVSSLNQIIISVKLDFKDSKYIEKSRLWSRGIVTVNETINSVKTPKNLFSVNKKTWNDLLNFVEANLLPAIIYYPNFLFDFPDQVLLEEKAGESKEQLFYRNVLQDILTSIDDKLLLRDHIVERYKSGKPNDIDSIESVVNRMSGQVTRFLVKSKMNVFNKLLENKEILIKYPKKNIDQNVFIEIKLKCGDDEYFIRERSLGFRWFFTYLLFTQFRTFRNGSKKLIFLFDEPASNLHQTGQHRLLDAFAEITQNSDAFIIYSTHSHHLISPQWLETTYIVKNNALNYEDDGGYDSTMTDISILKYRTFVSDNPSQISYFQPVLDILDYRPSNLENIPDVVMLEGKNDFYTLEYFNKVIGIGDKLNFIPGMGSGTLDSVIQLYYSWGRNFIILLDSDEAGQEQKKRYINKFGNIVKDKVFVLGDIDSKWNNGAMEKIFENNDALNLQQSVYALDTKTNKKKLNLSIQEMLINDRIFSFTNETKTNFENILKFLSEKINTNK